MKFIEDEIGTLARYPRFNFEEFLIAEGLEWKSYDSGDHKEFSINCPMCHHRGEPTPDTHKKLWINTATGSYHCYRCAWGGSFVRLIQKLTNSDFLTALKLLRGKTLDVMENMNLKLAMEVADFDVKTETELPEIELPYGYEPLDDPHPYLLKRGVPHSYAQENDWGVSVAGWTKDRLIIPYFMENRLVHWQARATWDEPGNKDFKKVLNPKGRSVRNILFNYDSAKHYSEIVIVEGFMDAVKAGPNAVATNGKRLFPEQLEWLQQTKAKSLVLAWDADAWSDDRRKKDGTLIKPCSMKVATDLARSYGFEVKAVRFPPGKDAGDFKYVSPALQAFFAKAKVPKFK